MSSLALIDIAVDIDIDIDIDIDVQVYAPELLFSTSSTTTTTRRTHIMIAIGLEGSANKLGVGLIQHLDNGGEPVILSNIRDTYNAPPGEGFMPQETAKHHRAFVVPLVRRAMKEANVKLSDVDCICYTKGPGMGAPLQSVAIAARMLSLLWDKPLVGVNHCVGRMLHLFFDTSPLFPLFNANFAIPYRH